MATSPAGAFPAFVHPFANNLKWMTRGYGNALNKSFSTKPTPSEVIFVEQGFCIVDEFRYLVPQLFAL